MPRELASASDISTLRFELIRNAAYSNDMLSFYTFAHRFVMFLGALLGTSIVGTVLGSMPVLAVIAGFLVTLATTADLVFGFADRSRTYESMLQGHLALLAELSKSEIESHEVDRLFASMLKLWERAPPLKYVAAAMAWNSAMLATTQPDELPDLRLIPISRKKQIFRHVIAYSVEELRQGDMKPRTTH